MLTIVFLIGAIGWAYYAYKYFEKKRKCFISIILCLVCSIGVICGCYLVVVSDKFIKTETTLTGNYELVSIKDGSTVDANVTHTLYHTYVSLNTDGVYTFYYKLGNKFKGKVTNYEDTDVIEEDNCLPRAFEYTTKWKYTNDYIWFVIFLAPVEKLLPSDIKSYEIHVPKGTIVSDYILDAEG